MCELHSSNIMEVPHTSSHYFRFVGSDVPSSELGKSALEVLKVFSKLSNLKMKSKS